MSLPERFNIRVYGLMRDTDGRILMTHEARKGFHFCKFPGGGLEPGEGLLDGLKREFKEELNISISVIRHVYTTDFFQASAFDQRDQIISIYYEVSCDDWTQIPVIDYPNQRDLSDTCFECFWIDLNALNEQVLSFPIDRYVAQCMQQGKIHW